MANTKKEILKSVRQRKFLNKSFDSLRADLLDYARQYYSDRIQDFSEAALGGLFLDMAAYVGDVTSFYLDHQFSELDVSTAVEDRNIERHLRSTGVDIVGAAPASVDVTFTIEVPATAASDAPGPRDDILPIIHENTILSADNGTQFILIENIDFSRKNKRGELIADITVASTDRNGRPATYYLSRVGTCVSGFRTEETFQIPVDFVPFRQITLGNANVSEILSVRDSNGNVYYEVTALVQDTVFKASTNINSDNELVNDAMELIPAPYRFTKQTSLSSRFTSLTFGGGNASTLDDDIIPDPTEFAIPLYGKRTFSRFTLDPGKLLKTRTLGIAATGVTLTIDYRYGGGLSHSVAAGSIRNISTLQLTFPSSPQTSTATAIRNSVSVINLFDASGGEDAPTISEFRDLIPSLRNAQARSVTKSDILARIYTLPTNFGRVFRAGIRANPNNPLATQLFIISRNDSGQLITSPDTLKRNLATYLNQFRMISDSIDILDVPVINLQVEFEVITDPTANKNLVLQTIIKKLREFFAIKNFQIDQPISLSDVENLIFNTQSVISVNTLKISNLYNIYGGRAYSQVYHDVPANTVKRLIVPPPGGIFEVRYPDVDIIGYAI
jgi:hypothetical protein